MQFLVVEVTGADSPLMRLLRGLPGVVLDVFLLAPLPGDTPPVRALLQVSGSTAESRGQVVQTFRQMDAGTTLMQGPGGTVRFNVGIPGTAMSREMHAVLGFASQNGVRTIWSRLEEGIAFVRILVAKEAGPLADALRDHLRGAGADAQVAVEEAESGAVVGRLQDMTRELEHLRRARGPA